MTKAIAAVLCFVVFLSGCAPTFRQNQFLNERIRSARTIAVMPMDVDVYKVTAGGVRELIDEYSFEAKTSIKAALEEEVGKGGKYSLKYFPDPQGINDPRLKQLMKDAFCLFDAVNLAIIMHTYNTEYTIYMPYKGIFEDRIKNFDYSLGPQISPLCDYFDADLLLFIKGGDSVSTGGRIALMALLTLVNAYYGSVTTHTNAGPPHLSVSLVDHKTGDILWYNFLCPEGGYNFRNKKSVAKFVNILLKDFPRK